MVIVYGTAEEAAEARRIIESLNRQIYDCRLGAGSNAQIGQNSAGAALECSPLITRCE